MAGALSVKSILEVHENVLALQRLIATQSDTIRQKDRQIEMLTWRLRGAEEMCLLARFAEQGFQTLLEATGTLNRARITIGNHFLAFATMSFTSSIDALRQELRTYRSSLQTRDESYATQCQHNEKLLQAIQAKDASIASLTSRVASLEQNQATEDLSSHFDSEIQARETLIDSLRAHNTQLMDALRGHGGKSASLEPSSLQSSALLRPSAHEDVYRREAQTYESPLAANRARTDTTPPPVRRGTASGGPHYSRGAWSALR